MCGMIFSSRSMGIRVAWQPVCFWLIAGVVAAGEDETGKVADDALLKLDQIVADYVKDDLAVGAEWLVIQNGVVRHHRAHGYSDREDKRLWKNNIPCNIRSMTKPITSAASQILIDRGKLELDEPVASYLESFDNDKSRDITVRHVLTHRSGLPLTMLIAPRQYKSLAEQVSKSGKVGPQFEPGSRFFYSDAGTDVVGRLVEKVSGEPLNLFVEREILKPLGMKDTFYGIDGQRQRLETAASAYFGKPNNWNRFWKPGGQPLYPFAWGSQTIYSTCSDYAKFLTMIANHGRVGDRQLLSKAAVERMLEPASLATVPGTKVETPTGFSGVKPYYGQMMVSYRRFDSEGKPMPGPPVLIGHSGSDGTNAWAWPDRQLVIVYFTQSRGGATAVRIEEHIQNHLIDPDRQRSEEVPDALRPVLGTCVANVGLKDEEVRSRKDH